MIKTKVIKYSTYSKEITKILSNNIEGMTCNQVKL